MTGRTWQGQVKPEDDVVIEYPTEGETYLFDSFGVYRYDTFPKGSVFEGEERRTYLGRFNTAAEAMKEFPTAKLSDSAKFALKNNN